uniref:Replicase n=1 Tax=Blattodean rhabdo-related virus OKIAV14 TaxID=2746364 RepID=A0A7D7FDT1_9RHAB|nr:RNA-dependent RNA polymerase [Blattodean rhabdo-related virus OKIAV14]
MESISVLELLGGQKTQKTPEPSHLDSPLRKFKALRWSQWAKRDLSNVRQYQRDIKGEGTAFSTFLKGIGYKPTKFEYSFGPIIGELSERRIPEHIIRKSQESFSLCYQVMIENFKTQWSSLADKFSLDTTPNLEDLPAATFFKLQQLYAWRFILEGLVVLTGKNEEPSKEDHAIYDFLSVGPGNREYSIKISSGLRIWVTKSQICIIHLDKCYVGDRDHLLLLSDIMAQRFISFLACTLAEVNQLENYPSVKELEYVFQWGDQIIQKYGNEGYKLTSCWEAICLACLLHTYEDPLVNNNTFYESMRQDFINTFPSERGDLEQIWNEISDFLSTLAKKNPHLLSQVFGLYRIWGHPTVETALGIAKLKQTACVERPINHAVVNKVLCVFKEQFCLEYRRKHQRWPKFGEINLPKDNYLHSCLRKNLPFDSRAKDYKLLHWCRVEFGQCFDIDPKFNLVELISDKAMSLGLNDLLYHASLGNIGPSTERSVIYQWLRSTIGDPGEFLKDICENGFGPDDQVTGVCPKEREGKIYPRLFGLLTLRKRMYVVLTEALLAEYILPYFPEITMMDDSLTLTKKMYYNTKDSQDDSRLARIVFTIMDFQKWNSNMREAETRGLFSCFDSLFGLKNCYTRTHQMFNPGQLYLADGTYCPKQGRDGRLREDKYCWSNHLGGIEGLRQKGWTIFTVCIIRLAARDKQMRFKLMGQGDNQVLRVSYPASVSADLTQLEHERFLDSLENLLMQVGPPLKRSETWSSSQLFIYGKYPIWKGCPLSMSLKRLCRMFRLSNEGYPTFESAISSISTNVKSATAQDFSPVIPFCIYSFETAGCVWINTNISYLGYDSFLEQLDQKVVCKIPSGEGRQRRVVAQIRPPDLHEIKSLHVSFMMRFLLLPRALGGYPTILLGQLFSQGFPDPLSEALSLLRLIWERHDRYKTIIVQICSVNFNPYICSDMICEDPLALNILHPSSPKEVLRRVVQDFLGTAEWIENPEFKSFLTLSSRRQKDLCDALLTMKPRFNPKVAHAVIESTVIGRALQVVGQVNKTNTMVRLTREQGEEDLARKILIAEENYWKSVIITLYSEKRIVWDPYVCSAVQAQQWREASWQLNITGVTVAPIWEAFVLTKAEDGNCSDSHPKKPDGYVLMKPLPIPHDLRVSSGLKLGPQTPYLGSKTEEKTRSYGKELSRKTFPLLKSAAGLLNLINWAVQPESNFAMCIRRVFSSITDLNPDLLIPMAGEVAGSLEHRYSDPSTHHGARISVLYTLASWVHLSTTSLTKYSRGGGNVNLHYQTLMSILVGIWSTNIHLGGTVFCPPTSYHGHLDCDRCITPIFEGYLDSEEFNWNTLIPSFPDNPLCWISSEHVQLTHKVELPLLSPCGNDYPRANADILYHQMIAEFCVKIVSGHASQLGSSVSEADTPTHIPVVWVFKLHPGAFIEQFIIRLLSFIVFNYPLSKEDLRSSTSLRAGITTIIENWPSSIFSWSSNLFLNSFFSDYMMGGPIPGKPPQTVPISQAAAQASFHQWVIAIAGHYSSEIDFFGPTPNAQIVRETTPLFCHPFFLTLIEEMMDLKKDLQRIHEAYKLFQMMLSSLKTQFSVLVSPDWIFRSFSTSERTDEFSIDAWEVVKDLDYGDLVVRVDHSLDWIRPHVTIPPTVWEDNMTEERAIKGLPQAGKVLLICKGTDLRDGELHTNSPDYIALQIQSAEKHELKIISEPTTASYKLLSCLRKLQIYKAKGVAGLGDGAGGFCLTMCRLLDPDHCFYNSLVEYSLAFEQSLSEFVPPAFLGYPFLRDKIINLTTSVEGKNDLTDPDYATWFYRVNTTKAFDVLTCDAEGGGWTSPEKGCRIATTCAQIGFLKRIPNLIIKTYLSNPSMVAFQITVFLHYYEKVLLWRSWWSSTGNTEIYLLVTNLRRKRHSLKVDWSQFPTLKKTTLMPEKLEQLKILETTLAEFDQVPSEKDAQAYSSLLEAPWTQDRISIELSLMIKNFSWIHQDGFLFPEEYVANHNKGLRMTRFSSKKTRWELMGRLTNRRVKKLVIGWCVLASVITGMPLSDMMKVCIFYAYATRSLHWEFVVSLVDVMPELSSSRYLKMELIWDKNDYKAANHLKGILTQRDTSKIIADIPEGFIHPRITTASADYSKRKTRSGLRITVPHCLRSKNLPKDKTLREIVFGVKRDCRPFILLKYQEETIKSLEESNIDFEIIETKEKKTSSSLQKSSQDLRKIRVYY